MASEVSTDLRSHFVKAMGADPLNKSRQADAEVLFEGPHDIERWNVRFRQGAVEMLEVVFTEPPNQSETADDGEPVEPKRAAGQFGELCLFLTIRNGKRALPMRMGYVPKKGDHASVAIHTYENKKALDLLGQQGWIPKTSEDPPPAAAK